MSIAHLSNLAELPAVCSRPRKPLRYRNPPFNHEREEPFEQRERLLTRDPFQALIIATAYLALIRGTRRYYGTESLGLDEQKRLGV